MNLPNLFYLLSASLCVVGAFSMLLSRSIRPLLLGFAGASLGVSGLLGVAGEIGAAVMGLMMALVVPAVLLLQFFLPIHELAQSVRGKKIALAALSCTFLLLAGIQAVNMQGRHSLGEGRVPDFRLLPIDEFSMPYLVFFSVSGALSIFALFVQRPIREKVKSSSPTQAKEVL